MALKTSSLLHVSILICFLNMKVLQSLLIKSKNVENSVKFEYSRSFVPLARYSSRYASGFRLSLGKITEVSVISANTYNWTDRRYVSKSTGMDTKGLPDETLYIIDGTSMFFQSYYGNEVHDTNKDAKLSKDLSLSLANYINHNFIHDESKKIVVNDTFSIDSGGLVSLASGFQRFIRDVQPRYVVVAFDSKKKNFRHSLFPAYKQHRAASPESLLMQLQFAPIIFDALGCQCFRKEGYEADDVMATISKWARERGLNVVHVSSDKDMIQLVGHGVHVMNPKTRKLKCIEDVIDEYGIHPRLFCDYQALTGDSADGIPGIKGIGPKTAAALINHFETIESLYRQLGLDKGDFNHLNRSQAISILNDEPPKKRKRSKASSSDEDHISNILVEPLASVRVTPRQVYEKLQLVSLTELSTYRQLVSLVNDIEGLIPPTDPTHDLSSHPLQSTVVDGDLNSHFEALQKDKYSYLLRQLATPQGHESLQVLLDSVFDDRERYMLSRRSGSNILNDLTGELTDENGAWSFKFTSTAFRYIGERSYGAMMMAALGAPFVDVLNKLRTVYHKLDRVR